MKKQFFLFSLLIALNLELAAQVNYTSNDISSTPNPRAGFLPNATVEQFPIKQLEDNPLKEAVQSSLRHSNSQQMADPSEIFTQTIDPLAEYKPERFDPNRSDFSRFQESSDLRKVGFDPSENPEVQLEKYKEEQHHKNMNLLNMLIVAILVIIVLVSLIIKVFRNKTQIIDHTSNM
jgi:hypothetical protein